MPFVLTALPFALITVRSAARDPVAWNDTLARFAMIPTHGIAAPFLQLQLWAVLIAMIAARVVLADRKKPDKNVWPEVLKTMPSFNTSSQAFLPGKCTMVLLLLVASLVALNSNLITGKESEFQGHYGRFVLIFAYIALFSLGITAVSRRLLHAIAVIVIGLACVVQFREMPRMMAHASTTLTEFAESDERAVLTWLAKNVPKDSVILAPNRLAMLIPVFTPHYVFMSKSARFFLARDAEIVKRYLVHAAFFPEEIDRLEGGTLSVFGNYGGAAYARAKRWYQLTHPLSGDYPKTIPDFIRHQDLRTLVEERVKKPDVQEVRRDLSAFALDYLVTPHAPPSALLDLFRLEERIGTLAIYTLESDQVPSQKGMPGLMY